ncbi:MAG: hypothetical protein J6U23_11390 [Clostridiales bacterium]|nr:hypothetical protein [Clostridiales bacterium]
MYINEYAGIRAKIPEGLSQASDSALEDNEAYNLSNCETNEDKIRESAIFYDAVFDNTTDGIEFRFENLPFAAPDDPNYDENKYLDDNSSFVRGFYKDLPITLEYQGRSEAVLNGQVYIRDIYTLSGNEGTQTLAYYARKLDDKLMCVIEIYWFGDETVEDYEKIFE